MYDAIIIGAGASGIFAAIEAKSKKNNLKILILERSNSMLSKVKLSGGGRCNITNATFDPHELAKNYPRGSKELLSAFNKFQPRDMIKWLEEKNVSLKIDENNKVFPKSDSSNTLIECFLKELELKKIEIRFNQNIKNILKDNEFFEILFENQESIFTKKVVLATGSSSSGLKLAQNLGHSIEPFIPSLFSFKIKKNDILKLSGISLKNVKVSIKNTKFSQIGSILITHEGFSGPAIINLSSFAAKYLFENNYLSTLFINWLNISQEEIYQILLKAKNDYPNKLLLKINPFNFPNNLNHYFINSYSNIFSHIIKNVTNKNLFRLSEKLSSDEYQIISKSQNKGEFVSCGGVNLKEVNFKDMQSKICKNLYLTGELLNIDGITGGYNLQNAWTTGFIAGYFL